MTRALGDRMVEDERFKLLTFTGSPSVGWRMKERAGDQSWLLAETDYGGPVTAMIGRDNMAGTQFHPEKSQKLGLALIANFLKWKP